ncbi:hypothetical protein A6F65_00576 [Paraurantiacibacter namhicola]|uniref:Uncharacterized protein n=2 Tax=Paraurantiacibacter namhicola TaxID=645517 RepID=A0A1C7D609_9SPHN|nr:hypothetical protein A6F65_00576 [Paraurantiacibacter namhicola]
MTWRREWLAAAIAAAALLLLAAMVMAAAPDAPSGPATRSSGEASVLPMFTSLAAHTAASKETGNV